MKKNQLFSVPVWGIAVAGIGLILLLGFFILNSLSSVSTSDGLHDCVNIDRSSYHISSAVFAEIPSPPSCFVNVVSAYRGGTFTNAFFFTPSYYLQPEFFPQFKEQGLPSWTSPSPTHYGAVGAGAFPFDFRSNVIKGGKKTFRFFIHSGYGVRSVQAVRLVAALADDADAKYITISLDSNASTGFLLGPSFPVLSSNWVQPVDVTVTFASNAPYRDYSFFLRTDSVDDDWFSAHVPEGTRYYYRITDFVGSQSLIHVSVVPS